MIKKLHNIQNVKEGKRHPEEKREIKFLSF